MIYTRKEERAIARSASTLDLYKEMERRGYGYDEKRKRWIDLNRFSIDELKAELEKRKFLNKRKISEQHEKENTYKAKVETPPMDLEPNAIRTEESSSEQSPATTIVANGLAELDADGWARMFERFNPLIRKMVYGAFRSDSEAAEVVQEVYIRLYETRAKYDPAKSQLVSWVMLLTRCTTIDRLRTTQRVKRIIGSSLEEAIQDKSSDQGLSEEKRERVAQVEDYIRTFPLDRQTVLELAYKRNLTLSQIAEQTGMPLGTVKTHINRGLFLLRQKFNNEEYRSQQNVA